MKNSNATPPTLIHPNANGSPKAGTMPEQALASDGFIMLRTQFGPQAFSRAHIAGFGPCVVQDTPAHAPRVELGQCSLLIQGIGPVPVMHDPSTVAQVIHSTTPRR